MSENAAPMKHEFAKFTIDPSKPIEAQAQAYFDQEMEKIVAMQHEGLMAACENYVESQCGPAEGREPGRAAATRFDFVMLQIATLCSADNLAVLGNNIRLEMQKHMPRIIQPPSGFVGR